MEPIREKAYAKVNLSLDILGKRQDGYHEVSMIMQQISLHDLIEISTGRQPGIKITSNKSKLPLNKNNLVYKAAEKLANYHQIHLQKESIIIHIEKNIPVAAGLAGGSADAAATFCALNRYWKKEVAENDLMDLGKEIGADVPYCLMGGTALAEGIGEKLTPLKVKTPMWMVLVKPPFSASTAEVYKAFSMESGNRRPDNQKIIEALSEGKLSTLALFMENVLQPVTTSMVPEIEKVQKKLLEFNAFHAMMSGSGTTVFGLFKTRKKAESAYGKIRKIYQETYIAHTIHR
ncbi:4-diphosphocytidyl-2-C-methyl-D-erythritol kinase [Tindallia magadiensis]|uniref:4-diphosphocytidyl-2-C-methyl-D-erythritol kinase n=1 Tax=Tindallia magadiensis TaxID=69895 RepID=A0A1I3CE51_9FIRM|nr:4-(cytidine 5'-diphospho)-2-C-methyl-D-erythritol kinase [Tindallia magadiensis]SFH72814.1 4-diphosphocytidyl-2-C-methyl-D-erythritol kinase [Tindallia magadiensis]